MTWAPVTPGFGLGNLPYGVARLGGGEQGVVVRVGDHVLDLTALTDDGLLPAECGTGNLDALMAAGFGRWSEVRATLTGLLSNGDHRGAVEPRLHPLAECTLALPFTVADFVDFYSSEAHATNVGRLFRPGGASLPENWRHLPVGYHGRSGTVVVSGTPIVRPSGQRRGVTGPAFGPSTRLDFELEMGFVVGGPSTLGEPVPIDRAEQHLFGVVLLNDWSARDIQAWEYIPLGPFLGKSFATTVSPWIVPMAALADARVPQPRQDPRPLPYLTAGKADGFAIDLTASLSSEGMRADGLPPVEVTSVGFGGMYWSVAQQIAHLTVNGASLRTGDLLGSGTVSGWESGTYGSLLETTASGPLALSDGTERSFLVDGDEVVLRGRAGDVDFGEARGVIV